MRTFVFLLILGNLLFLAWTQGYLGASSNPDAFRLQQQLLADQVKIVARDVPPPEITKTEAVKTETPVKAVEKKADDACVLLNDLPTAETDKLEARLAEKFPAFKVVRTDATASTSYWVFIPPLPNKKDADTKSAELKKLGVPEFFVMQESGANNLAISLGLFSTREAAASRLEMLRGKGVKSAKIKERSGKPVSATLEVRGPEAQADALRQTVTDVLPEIKPAICKIQPLSGQ